MSGISFALRPIAPFSLELTVWALRRRAANQVDRWDGRHYSRIFVFKGNAVKVLASQEGGIEKPRLNVVVVGKTSDLQAVKSRISSTLEKMLSLRSDFKDFMLCQVQIKG